MGPIRALAKRAAYDVVSDLAFEPKRDRLLSGTEGNVERHPAAFQPRVFRRHLLSIGGDQYSAERTRRLDDLQARFKIIAAVVRRHDQL